MTMAAHGPASAGPAAAHQAIADEWLRDGRRVVSAILVGIEGSAPLAAGATMLVDEQGRVEGSITGGCVEGAVVEEARAVLGGGPPKVVTYGISDELAGTVGLMCGGIVHVFVHELGRHAALVELAALDAVRAGQPAAIATLLDGAQAGAQLAICGNRTVGSLGGPSLLDANVARDAEGLLDEGKTTMRRYGQDGATMGDAVRVHVRAFAPPRQMVVVGAIDFSAAIAPMARQLGYDVTICDARPAFARSRRFSSTAEVVMGWPQEVLPTFTLGPRDAVLVFTHDPKFDEPAVVAALATGAGYVGALGSRRTTEDRNRRLREAGVAEDELARVHAPCGLDVGARTPDETAVSVLAEIIAERAARTGRPLGTTEGPIHAREVS